jgi:MFS family permease
VALSFVLLNAPVQLAMTHQVAHLVESGIPRMTAAGLVGLMGLFSIAGKVGWGFLSDRWWLEWTYAAGILILVAGIAALLALGPSSPAWLIYAYAACLGVGYAISPALTPILTGRFFAGPNFGAVFGVLAMVHNSGGAAGMWLAGYAHDLTGSYRLPLLASMASAVLAGVAIWLLAPRRIAPKSQ